MGRCNSAFKRYRGVFCGVNPYLTNRGYHGTNHVFRANQAKHEAICKRSRHVRGVICAVSQDTAIILIGL